MGKKKKHKKKVFDHYKEVKSFIHTCIDSRLFPRVVVRDYGCPLAAILEVKS